MDCLVSKFAISKLNFQTMYTTGSIHSFSQPCIGYIIKGRGKFFYKGQNYYANEGDIIYIAKDTRYYSIWYGDPDIEFYSVGFDFIKPYTFYEYRFQILKDFDKSLFDEMYNHYDARPLSSMAAMYTMLERVYERLIPQECRNFKSSVENAVSYIENNYSSDISMEELASISHLSKSSLFKLFKESTGVTPIAYKHNIMIQHALDMLAHTDKSIDEISHDSGFSSSNYFRKIFYRYTGKTPKDIRKKT